MSTRERRPDRPLPQLWPESCDPSASRAKPTVQQLHLPKPSRPANLLAIALDQWKPQKIGRRLDLSRDMGRAERRGCLLLAGQHNQAFLPRGPIDDVRIELPSIEPRVFDPR